MSALALQPLLVPTVEDRPSGVRVRPFIPSACLRSHAAEDTGSDPVTLERPTPPPSGDKTEARPTAGVDDLVLRASRGDRSAFRALYDAHRKQVARLVFRMLGSPREVDDVVQDVFVQVFRSLGDFRGQSKFTTWLHRVTVNVVLMHRRAKKSRPAEGAETPLDFEADRPLPDAEAASLRRRRAFARLVETIGEKKRIVFVLHDLEGLSPAEIGEIVDAPVLTVRTRLFYARRELEALLATDPELASYAGSFSGNAVAGADGEESAPTVTPAKKGGGR